jgi:hypothetical protein
VTWRTKTLWGFAVIGLWHTATSVWARLTPIAVKLGTIITEPYDSLAAVKHLELATADVDRHSQAQPLFRAAYNTSVVVSPDTLWLYVPDRPGPILTIDLNDGGLAPGDLRGQLIDGLLVPLGEAWKDRPDQTSRVALIAIDASTSFATLRQLLFTLGQAGYSDIRRMWDVDGAPSVLPLNLPTLSPIVASKTRRLDGTRTPSVVESHLRYRSVKNQLQPPSATQTKETK